MTDDQFLLALFLGPPVLAGLGLIGLMALQEWEAWHASPKGTFMGWWLAGTTAVIAGGVGWVFGSAVDAATALAAWSIETVSVVRGFLAIVLGIGTVSDASSGATATGGSSRSPTGSRPLTYHHGGQSPFASFAMSTSAQRCFAL